MNECIYEHFQRYNQIRTNEITSKENWYADLFLQNLFSMKSLSHAYEILNIYKCNFLIIFIWQTAFSLWFPPLVVFFLPKCKDKKKKENTQTHSFQWYKVFSIFKWFIVRTNYGLTNDNYILKIVFVYKLTFKKNC